MCKEGMITTCSSRAFYLRFRESQEGWSLQFHQVVRLGLHSDWPVLCIQKANFHIPGIAWREPPFRQHKRKGSRNGCLVSERRLFSVAQRSKEQRFYPARAASIRVNRFGSRARTQKLLSSGVVEGLNNKAKLHLPFTRQPRVRWMALPASWPKSLDPDDHGKNQGKQWTAYKKQVLKAGKDKNDGVEPNDKSKAAALIKELKK